MPEDLDNLVGKLKQISAALGAAIADRTHELDHAIHTDLYFDADVVLGAVFMYHNLCELIEEQLQRQPLSLGGAVRGLRDHHLVRSLWCMGYFGTVRMLAPHIVEMVDRASSLAQRSLPDDKTLETIEAWGGIQGIKSRLAAPPALPQEQEAEESDESDQIEALASVVSQLGWSQFVVLDTITMPNWRDRRRGVAEWLEIPDEPEDSFEELSSLAVTWKLRDELAEQRPDVSDRDRNLVDAAALVALARPLAKNDSSGLRRFHTQTKVLADKVVALSSSDEVPIGSDAEIAWNTDQFPAGPAMRSSQYLLLRMLSMSARLDQPSERTPQTIAQDRKGLEELRSLRQEIRDSLAHAPETPRGWAIKKFQLKETEELCANLNAAAFARSVLLDPKGRAAKEIGRRRPLWQPTLSDITEHASIIESMLPDGAAIRYVEELRLMREYRDPMTPVRLVNLPAWQAHPLDADRSLVDSGLARWLGGLGTGTRTNPTAELARASKYVAELVEGEHHREIWEEYIRKGIRFEPMKAEELWAPNDSIIACAMFWLLGNRSFLASSLEANLDLIKQGHARAQISSGELLSLDILRFAAHALLGRASLHNVVLPSEVRSAHDLFEAIVRVGKEDELKGLQRGLMYTGLSWACAYACVRGPSSAWWGGEIEISQEMMSIGLEASEQAWTLCQGASAGIGCEGAECLACASALTLLADLPIDPRTKLWLNRAESVLDQSRRNIWLVDAYYWCLRHVPRRVHSRTPASSRVILDRLASCSTAPLGEPHQAQHRLHWRRLAASLQS